MNTNAAVLFHFARFSAYAILGSSLGCAAVGDLGDDDPRGSTTSTAMSTHGSLETTSSAGTTSSTASTLDTSGLASTSSTESLTSGTEESGLASDDTTTGMVCDPGDCEDLPRPHAPCADGSTPNATCVPLEGRCAWLEDACPEPCTEDECGPPPPTDLCPDGITHSELGPCERRDDGLCAYTILECPLCCSETQLPDCPEPITCCADGTWLCGTPDECPDGATALACEIPACQPEGASCANGESCCRDSTCCAGVPILPGEEFCSSTCPVSDRARKANFAPVDVRV